jgi:hypothetical protein
MATQRLEFVMRTQIIVHAALLLLGLSLPALAAPRILPPPPAQEMETKPRNESRQTRVMPPAPARGQMLYENHCIACHESMVHIRTRQQAKSLPQLRARVLHWAEYLQLRWGKDDVEDVVIHLDSQYYQFEHR